MSGSPIGSVHAVTLLGGYDVPRPRRAELLQPAHQRLDLSASTSRTTSPRSSRRHHPAPLDHRLRRPPRAWSSRSRSPSWPAASRGSRSAILGVSHEPLHDPVAGAVPAAGARSPGSRRTTVVIGLALYALTILVRSILEGLRSVPDEVRRVRQRVWATAPDPAAAPRRAAAGAPGDHGRAAGGHGLDGRADHDRLAGVLRRPRQPDQGRRDPPTSAPSCSPRRCSA